MSLFTRFSVVLFSLLFSLSAAVAEEWKTLDFGSCSINLPSQWYVYDKKSTESFSRFNNEPDKKRLLASRDSVDASKQSMIARLNSFPLNEEVRSEVKSFTRSDLDALTNLFKEQYEASRHRNIVVITHIYPYQLVTIDGNPTLVTSYVRQGPKGEDWFVRIFEIFAADRKYQITLSLDNRFPENEKILGKILASFKWLCLII